ncbi:MAG: hypothetical protein AAB966_00350 [Patescibacteria group bacterium]
MDKCDRLLKDDKNKIETYALREAFYHHVFRNDDSEPGPTARLFSFVFGKKDKLEEEYRNGRFLNDYRDECPNFLYQYRMGYCEKKLIAKFEKCSIDLLYQEKQPYIIQETPRDTVSLEDAIDAEEKSIKFQFLHGISFLNTICDLRYEEFDPETDLMVEKFDEPIFIHYNGAFYLKTQYRLIFLNFFKLKDNSKLNILGIDFSKKIDKDLTDLYEELEKAGTIQTDLKSGTLMSFGPCYSVNDIKMRYGAPGGYLSMIDLLFYEVTATEFLKFKADVENFENNDIKILKQRKEDGDYVQERLEDKRKMRSLLAGVGIVVALDDF